MTIYTLLGTGGHTAGAPNDIYNPGNYYSNVGLGRCAMKVDPLTTESYASQIARIAGTITYLSWRLDYEFGTPPAPLILRLSSPGLEVAIPEGTTGWVTDSFGSVSVALQDPLCFITTVGGTVPVTYDHSFYCVSARFEADTGSAQMLATVGSISITPSPVWMFFLNFLGCLYPGDYTEGDRQFVCWAAGMWQNMACYVESNDFSADTTFSSRINGNSGSMAICIPAGQSGYFEDTLDSDPVAQSDLLDYAHLASDSGSGSFTMSWVGAYFLATETDQCVAGGATDEAQTIESGNTYYGTFFGGGEIESGIEGPPRATGLIPYDLTASNYVNYLSAADEDAYATFTVSNRGMELTATSGAGCTGYFMDLTDEVKFYMGDTITNQIAVYTNWDIAEVTWYNAGLLLTVSG